MANFTINWTPPGPLNCISQTVQYRDVSLGGSWEFYISVGPSVGTTTVLALDDNTIYEFRIVNECIYGGTVPSDTTIDGYKIICPVLTVVPAYSVLDGYTVTVNWSVPTGVFLYTTYDFYLMDSTGVSVIDSQLGETTVSPSVQSFIFSGLTAATTYQIHVDVNLDTFIKTDCLNKTFTTAAAVVCNTPNLISVQPL